MAAALVYSCGDGKSDSGGLSDRQVQCAIDQILANGLCTACDAREVTINNRCEACASNEININNACVACASNEITVGNACVACADNEIIVDNMCVACGANQQVVDGICENIAIPAGSGGATTCGGTALGAGEQCVRCNGRDLVNGDGSPDPSSRTFNNCPLPSSPPATFNHGSFDANTTCNTSGCHQ